MAQGRKSLKNELSVLRRYDQLSPKVFKFVDEMLDSKKIANRKWGAEWLKNGYSKLLPQQLTGIDNEPLIIKLINYAGGAEKTVPIRILPKAK